MSGTTRRRIVRARVRWTRVGALMTGLAALLAVAWPLSAGTGRGTTCVIPIRGEINDILKGSVARRLAEAKAAGARTIIVTLDTPGGLVTSALEICRMIKSVPAEIRTIAFVDPQAYSAGAMISVAAQEIWMAPSSSIGDCAPIMVTPVGGLQELGGAERAKAESPILQEFRDSAARNGYNHLLCRAMVAFGEEVWWLENTQTHERKFVNAAEKKTLIDGAAADERQWELVRAFIDPVSKREFPVEQPIDRADTLLTMSQGDAVAFGFARGIAIDTSDLVRQLQLAGPPAVLDVTGWEQFVSWLNSPIVRGILLVIVLVGGYVEFHSPGVILPGVVALIALAIFLGAPYAAGLADIWTIVLLLIGLALLVIEIFVIPGFGVAGVLGIALMAVAIIGSFMPGEPRPSPFSLPQLQSTWDGLKTGVIVMSTSVIFAFIGILVAARYLPRLPTTGGLISANPDGAALALSDPYIGVADVGTIGIVTGDLRPGGQARFGQEIVEVQSQGEYIEAGCRVQVIKRDGMNVVVRPLREQA